MRENEHIFEFDDVRIEPSEFRAWKADVELAMEPKTFHVLLFLLENRGRLIEKTELLDAVWHDTFVTENAMTREIAKLRRALGDGPKEPKYIKTIHTRGYCFVAEVRESSGGENRRKRPPAGNGKPLTGARLAAACGLLALFAIIALAWWGFVR